MLYLREYVMSVFEKRPIVFSFKTTGWNQLIPEINTKLNIIFILLYTINLNEWINCIFLLTGSLKFEDEVTSIRSEVTNLQGIGVNKIIALGHAGFAVDTKIATEVEGVDVVIGGHTNTFLYTGKNPRCLRVVVVVGGGGYQYF